MIDMDLIVASSVMADGQAEREELERLRREDPCRYCGGSRVTGAPDYYSGLYDPCDGCEGTGVEGGF